MSLFGLFFGPIPEIFWSVYSGEPFLKCIDCEVPLAEANTYIIQKRFVATEAVFEMAMCERCRDKMIQQYSEETRRNITNYLRAQFEKLMEETGVNEDGTMSFDVREIDDPEEGSAMLHESIDFCILCGTRRSECHRYSLTGVCRDDEIVVQITPMGRTPLMVCEKCELGMNELVSQQTRDAWDRFIQKHFGPPGIESDSPTSYPIAF
ncbi:MAG: hypothetical protein R3C59_01005 [Planctomycetaceae bacterium]